MKPVVYTIGRQYGSGGREIGQKLAKKLGIPFYDNELIALAAKKSGVSEEIFKQADEKPTNSFLYSLAIGAYSMGQGLVGYTDMSINDKLFIAQSQVIEDAVAHGSCVIVGRCADYVLRDYPNLINIFVCGELEDRYNALAKDELKDIPRQKAIEMINKKDKTRANFYNYYSNKKWGDMVNHDLIINTSDISRDDAVELIVEYTKYNQKKKGL